MDQCTATHTAKCIRNFIVFFFSSRRRHTRSDRDWSSDVCSSDLKPFFYYWTDNVFLFGSELKALMATSLFHKEIDINAVGSFMQYGYVPAPSCIFRNSFKL